MLCEVVVERKTMSELVVVSFDDKFKADEVLLSLLKLEQEHLLSLDDAVVVTKNAEGKLRVKAYHDLVKPANKLGNELWGGIISAIVFHRQLTIDDGIFDSHFLTEVEDSLQPNASALFTLVKSADSEKVLTTLSGVGGKVLKTTLPEGDQQKLQSALRGTLSE
jgi:uncharacterized membrane protein